MHFTVAGKEVIEAKPEGSCVRTKEVRRPRCTVAGVRGRKSGDLGSDVTVGLKGANQR